MLHDSFGNVCLILGLLKDSRYGVITPRLKKPISMFSLFFFCLILLQKIPVKVYILCW